MPPNHFESEVESFLEGSHGDRTHIKRADHHTVTPLCGTLLRLLYAPYNSHAIIAFGQLHSISKGTAPNTYFVRLCRPNGGPTKVSIMIGSEHYASLRPRIHLAKVEPSKWTLIACGTITGKTTDKRYLRPFDGLSLYLQRTSALGFDNLAQPRTSGPHSGGAPSRA